MPIDTDPGKFLHHHKIQGSRAHYQDKIDKIKTEKVDKKFYLGLSFENISNPEFNSEMLYPVEFVKAVNKYFMPQINHMSFIMPSSPLLYQFNDTPAVNNKKKSLSFFSYFINLFRQLFVMKPIDI